MSGGGAPAKDPKAPTGKDPEAAYVELAEKIFIQLAANVYGTLASGDVKKPDPKALALFAFKLADAFEHSIGETDRMKAKIEAENKAKVKLDEVDLSGVIGGAKK